MLVRVSKKVQGHLVSVATEMREYAISWRGFRVGVASIGFTPDGAPKFFAGANIKARKSDPKDCGEMQVMRAAYKAGVKLAMIVVVGRLNGEKTRTLHPCGECREIMRWHVSQRTGVVTPETVVICIRPRCRIREKLTIKELMKIHNEPL